GGRGGGGGGGDAGRARENAGRAAGARADDPVERLADQFIEQHAKGKPRPNTARATAAAFRNDVLPAWRGRSIHDIARRDVIALLEQIAADRPILAKRVKGVLSKFFGWLCERDGIAASSCASV